MRKTKKNGSRARDYQIGVILTKEEYDAITADATANGLTRSGYARMVLLNAHNKGKEEK